MSGGAGSGVTATVKTSPSWTTARLRVGVRPGKRVIMVAGSCADGSPQRAQRKTRRKRRVFHFRLRDRPLVVSGFLHRVLEAADGVLHLAGDLLGLAFGLELAVAVTLPATSFTLPLACSALP